MNTLNRDDARIKCQFATYLNMAVNNLMNLLVHIANKYLSEDEKLELKQQLKKDIDSKQLNESSRIEKEDKGFKDKLLYILQEQRADPLRYTKITDSLKKNLPFLEALSDSLNSPDKEQDLESLGNKYSDKYAVTISCCYNMLFSHRNKSSHGSKVFKTNGTQKRQIKGTPLISALYPLWSLAQKTVKARFSFSRKDMTAFENIEEPDSLFCFYKADTENSQNKTDAQPDNQVLSETGLIFFTCLFLEKKYIRLFLENTLLPLVKDDTQKKIVYELFSCLRMRQIRERLDCEKPDMALGLDMVNELCKCPKPLYDLLSYKDKKIFRIKSADDTLDDALMIRKKDRFAYFAMRFIDEQQLFKAVRFQVALGNYRYKFYEKKCIDGNNRLRILQKELNGFGRLQEIEKERQEQWAILIRDYDKVTTDTVETTPYITDCHAHYVFNANRVGLSLKGQNYLPPIKTDKAPCLQPDCWLSTYELPAVIFLLLCGGDPEGIITRHINNLHRLYQDIIEDRLQPVITETELKEKYNLPARFIPEKIRNYLFGKTIDVTQKFEKHVDKKLEKIATETFALINEFKELEKKNKKPQTGRLAQFLAKDIITLQPVNDTNDNKLTGLNFSVMQSTLALYDYDSVKRLFASSNILNGQYAHPFLNSVIQKRPADIYSFYFNYLDNKKRWIKNRYKKGTQNCAFLHQDALKWAERTEQYYKDLAGRYLEQPVELPSGLFTQAIKKLLKKTYTNNYLITQILSVDKCNVNYMITRFFEIIRNDKPQAFYSYKRPEIEKLELSKKEIIKKEREFRQYQVEDMLTLLMAEKILIEDVNTDTKLKLSDIASADKNTGIMDKPFSFNITITTGEKRTKIYQDIKPKDYGKFLSLLYDKRIKTLLGKIPETEIQKEIIDKELENFDKTGPEIFYTSNEYENFQAEKNPNLTKGKSSPSFTKIMELDPSMTSEERTYMENIRNAFSHNFYPDVEGIYDKKSLPDIAPYLGKVFKLELKIEPQK